jgi:hypothetical protein
MSLIETGVLIVMSIVPIVIVLSNLLLTLIIGEES